MKLVPVGSAVKFDLMASKAFLSRSAADELAFDCVAFFEIQTL